ncbi:MAG: cyclase family protein [Termitinemataceae bacterium]|nr:MAG: cyclase family protein [Termitinemataceae bacterium]
MYKLLSYPITASMPTWPCNPQLKIEKHAQIAKGDVCNTAMISVFGHTGTHYDAPNHFVADGLQIASLPLERFIFEKPLLLDIPKDSCQKITASDLQNYADKISKCDLLMLRTGFSKYRKQDTKKFEECGPAIGSDCSSYLVNNFKNLQALAVDFVSIASYSDQVDGNLTHRILLGGMDCANDHFICAIEDVNLSDINPENLKRVMCFPLMVEGVDSSPVTIVAEII